MTISSDLPFRVEVWTDDDQHIEEVLAASSHLLVARAAWREACRHRPRSIVRLRNLAQVIEERLKPGN